jgi:hypothetical protein
MLQDIEFVAPTDAQSIQATGIPTIKTDAERHLEHEKAKLAQAYAKGRVSRNVRPWKRDRGRMLVKLRDEEGLTFKEIRRRLTEKNPKWTKTKSGKLITLAALAMAYRREKEAQERERAQADR